MSMIMWALLGLALGLASPFMVLQLQRWRDTTRSGVGSGPIPSHRIRPRNPFAAVSIRPEADNPCAAALHMAERRYLAVNAPSLPVPGCDRGRCGCRYMRHADRRAAGDRRDAFARFGGMLPNTRGERRSRAEDRRRDRPR
ncbi:MAG: hypothetical protein L6Q83_05040 [Gammaproteobacteria bacterium]|nr:hypothetical protein [Gammaproteobacteria bacterium]